jgi:hypothetical protein
MDNVDLNLNNYDLDDLLALFNIDSNFGKSQLKKCYKMALMTHPDKSGLDRKFFIFFTKAFKLLKQIYTFRLKSSCPLRKKNTDYNMLLDDDGENKELIDKIKTKKNFNKWFNQQFELVKEQKDDGHGEWLASDNDLNTSDITNRDQMNAHFSNIKKNHRALVLHKDYTESNRVIGTGNAIIEEEDIEYSSDIFSKLRYNDVKEVHSLEKGVIPVTEEDYKNRKKYGSVNELETSRAQQVNGIDYSKSAEDKMKEEENEKKYQMTRAYKYAKQMEEMKKKQEKWWYNIKQLEQ